MDQQRDFEQEEILGDIICDRGDVLSIFLNETDSLEGEEACYDDQTMEEESQDHDGGSSDRDDSSDDRTESGSAVAKSCEVYIYKLSMC